MASALLVEQDEAGVLAEELLMCNAERDDGAARWRSAVARADSAVARAAEVVRERWRSAAE
eukprot:14538117-Heterocapsa_arctica.AAC.1